MSHKADRDSMRKYLYDHLKGTCPNFEPVEFKSGAGQDFTLFLKGDDTVVFAVDQEFPEGTFKQLYAEAWQTKKNVATVVLKDGETFFRNGAQKVRDHHLDSLHNYRPEDIDRVLILRPEEIFLRKVNNGLVQYYQPQREGKQEGIFTHRLTPVHFDYSYIDPRERFRPRNANSKRYVLPSSISADPIQSPWTFGKGRFLATRAAH